MSYESSQKTVDGRNLIFAISVLVAMFFLLTILIERNMFRIHPAKSIPSRLGPEQGSVMTKSPVIPKTTVSIQPLVTRFPPLPDFKSIKDIDKRKAAFIDYLTPIINYQNEKVLKDRERLEEISKKVVDGGILSSFDRKWLKQLAEKYEIKWTKNDLNTVMVQLARRVDIVPVSLALVQAAIESSWGRSRYAVQANNLFGQWCYDAGCGVIPADRAPDAIHEVKRFRTVNDAVRSYIHNLNTHPKYTALRQIRQGLRLHHRKLTGDTLANGLLYYSQRREAYVDEVKIMIEQYRYFQERRTG